MPPKWTLAEAVDAGLAPDGNLCEALKRARVKRLKSLEDAEAICRALEHLVAYHQPSGKRFASDSALHELTSYFQLKKTEEAAEVLAERGIPLLAELTRQQLTADEPDSADVMFMLKMLVGFGTLEGTEVALEALHSGKLDDEFMWSVALANYSPRHPHWREFMDGLPDPLPEGFVTVAILDCANALAIAGESFPHPFDTPAGKERLHGWLVDSDPDNFSYALSATASLPFISKPERDQLLALAMDHPSPDVQLEAAWATAKLGSEGGIKLLARMCLDATVSQAAQRYLDELGRADAIPEAALEPDFLAMSEMSAWLAHPQEFGRSPDAIELYDTRELFWPPTGDQRRVWLFKYTYQPREEGDLPQVGIGMVGSVTFALFGDATADKTPEQLYALHCGWEQQSTAEPYTPASAMERGRRMLAQRNPEFG